MVSGTSGDDLIRNGGDDSSGTWHNGGSNVTIDAGVGNDSVFNNGDYVTINTGEGNDSVFNNGGSSVTINTSAGNDSVDNVGNYATINAGDGNDSIWNGGSHVTINAGGDNDYVRNWDGSSVKINTDAGNDSVENLYGSSVTINTGAGDDLISLGSVAWYNLIKYKAGDGNDKILGFNETSTLSISGGSYSTTTSGSSIIVTVDDGNITLSGAARLSTVNIKFKETSSTNSKLITLSEGNDTYNNTVNGATINALGGNDTIYNGSVKVKINSGSGNDTIENVNDSVTIVAGAGNDSISNWGSNVTIAADAGDDYVNNSGNSVTINTGAGNDFIYNHAGSNATINTGAGNDSVYNRYVNNCTINTGIDNDFISLNAWSDDSLLNFIQYKLGDGNDIIYGFDGSDTLSIGGGSYSTKQSGDNIIVTVGEGKISLIGAASLSSVNIKGTETVTEKNSWKLSGTTATYGTSSKTLVTVKGVKSADGLSVKNKIVTIAASALNKSKVTISNGYTLKLGSDVSTTATTSNDWSYKNSVATLKQTKGAAYSLASDGKSISYSAGTSKTLTKVSGVKSADGLSVSGKVVTVAASALNKSKVTISGGYKLALGSDVSTTATTSNAWSYKNSVATYKQTRGAAYSLASNKKSITYTAATSKNLAKMSGVKSASGLKVSGKVITVPNSIIKSDRKVSVNGSGYNFKFAAQKTLITGSKNADIITSTGANSTINASKGNDLINLGANNVIVYKNGDGRDTINNYSENDTIKITSGAAQVTTRGSDILFNVGKGSILLKDAVDKTVSYVAGGVKKTYTATSSDEPYTVKGAAVILASSYAEESFDVANDVDGGNKIKTIDASAVSRKLRIKGNSLANSIKGGSGNDTLRGEGNDDTLTGGKGSDVFIYYDGDGEDVITDYEAKDTIKILDGSVSVSTLRSDVVLSVGAGKITVQDAFEKEIGVTYIEDGIEHDYLNGEQTVVLNEKKTNATITKNYWKESLDFANFGKSTGTVDATQVMHNIKITGNDKANKILGGSGKNTLIGGGGNDTLQGGDKADIFVYSAGDGNDILYNVGANDTISIVSGTVDLDSVKGDTVILKIGDGNISIEGGAGNKITYCDEHGKTSKLYSNPNANVVDNWFVEDDNFATDNDLSSLVQSKAADYSVVNVESALRSVNALETLTCSTKT